MKQINEQFSCIDLAKASAVVSVFETSKLRGDYSALAVLDDGAGISYGIRQFTHRSGALLSVVERYIANGGKVGIQPIRENLAVLRSRAAKSIAALAANSRFKSALKAAAISREMRLAQESAAFEMFLLPAIEICERMGFRAALSLAVVHDSIVHGSWERIRDRVSLKRDTVVAPADYEKAWISEYVRRRGEWLRSIPRLQSTIYRIEFFQRQIEQNNWALNLPVMVNGIPLTDELVRERAVDAGCLETESAELRDSRKAASVNPDALVEKPQDASAQPTSDAPRAVQPNLLEGIIPGAREAGKVIGAAAESIDEAELIVKGIARRRDAVKSIWATVGGTAWQAIWAVFAFLIGLPGYVWLIAALAAMALVFYYLHRQIALGKIREKAEIAAAGR